MLSPMADQSFLELWYVDRLIGPLVLMMLWVASMGTGEMWHIAGIKEGDWSGHDR